MRRLGHRSHMLPAAVAVIVLTIALVTSVGICVADAHAGMHHGGDSGSPLCVGAPSGSPAAVAHVRLAIVGDALTAPSAGITPAPLDVLELPPKA